MGTTTEGSPYSIAVKYAQQKIQRKYNPKSPADELRDTEWNGMYGQCRWCLNYENKQNLRGLSDSMIGHTEDCEWVRKILPRIAELDLGGVVK